MSTPADIEERIRAAGTWAHVYYALGSPDVWTVWHDDHRLAFFQETTGLKSYKDQPTYGRYEAEMRYDWWNIGPERAARQEAFLQWLKDKYAPLRVTDTGVDHAEAE